MSINGGSVGKSYLRRKYGWACLECPRHRPLAEGLAADATLASITALHKVNSTFSS
jgi:hypothetical protein